MKSQIRKEVEKIMEHKFSIVFIDNRVNGCYRMKFVTTINPSEATLEKIRRLPHVTKVKDTAMEWTIPGSYYTGIAVYTDCRPRDIQI